MSFAAPKSSKPAIVPSLLRRALVAGIAAIGIAAPFAAQAAGSVKIGTTTWIGYGPFYVAEAMDFYKKYNVKVSFQSFSDPALIPPAIASGSVEGGMLTYDQVIGVVAKGQAMKVIMPIDYSNGGDAIVSPTGIGSVADLKGKTIAYNTLSPSDFLLSYALSTQGMSEKDIKPVNMTPDAVPAAILSNKVNLGVTYEPFVSTVLGQGGKKFKVLYSSKDAPGLIADVLVFDAKSIAGKSAEIKGVIQGYVEALDYIKKKPDDAAKIIGKAMGVSAKEVKEQWAGVYNIPLAEMPKAFQPAKETTSYYASGEVIAKILVAKGQITAAPKPEDTFDGQFVKAIIK
ncbi:ABC transporter substrate-binding protein [Derxia gummosa]|uniref:ABC transporter substrate-binding protein n=1 Tax=Derxia gummosa DSM 723 TaxID=1121388 RepID=A0A8B6X4Q4_9BURK|nr:ABC transporter substrate-binding protein [Derxia gummosa]